MQDKGLSEFKSLSGILQSNGSTVPVNFAVRIDPSGEVEFDFGIIPLSQDTFFIKKNWHHDSPKLSSFSVSGQSEDGFEFKTDDLQFNSLKCESSKESGHLMMPTGRCSKAEFHSKPFESVPKPIILMYLKGFRNFGQLSTKCSLGTIALDGISSILDTNTITGRISIYSDKIPEDLSAWRMEADKLLEHVRRVMSFASATVLQAPVIEFRANDCVDVVVLSQTRQAPAHMNTFHYLNQQPIFDTAVKSFFRPPVKVNNLFFAIEWFAMDATYNEVRLVNAMTVLENLVASNLGDNDVMIRPLKEFEKTRTKLRQVIKKCVNKWSDEETDKAKEVVAELNERLSDLNRRSILQKIKILAALWSVPLDGIGDDKIKSAKRARDLIVHRGHYYNEEGEVIDDLG